MQTIWLQNVGQERKEACMVKLRLQELSTNFPCRGFRSCDVFRGGGVDLHDCELIASVRLLKDKSGLLQLGVLFLQLWPSLMWLLYTHRADKSHC